MTIRLFLAGVAFTIAEPAAGATAPDASTAPPTVEEVAAAPVTSAPVPEAGATVNEVGDVETTAPAPVADPLGLQVGARVGAMLPTSDLGLTYFAALEVGYRLPVWQRLVGVGLELSLAGPGDSGTVRAANVGGSFDYELSTRIIGLGLEAFAGRAFGAWSPYGALGYGLYFLHLSERSFGYRNDEDQVRAGFQLRGGCGYRLGPGELVGELRYHYVAVRFKTTGRSNAGGVTFAAGYRLGF